MTTAEAVERIKAAKVAKDKADAEEAQARAALERCISVTTEARRALDRANGALYDTIDVELVAEATAAAAAVKP